MTISNIPIKAYEYIVNGKSAIEWIMEKYCITTDKSSKLDNNPNKYEDDKYSFKLLLSVISISIKTVEILDGLPEYKEI